MKRLIDWHLKKWKEDRFRKPLLLRGARQVGKTYALRKLGQSFENCVEINFEFTKEVKKIFEKDLRPDRILQELILFTGQMITPGKTLLFLDEVQECPEAIQSLRYFYELIPSLHVAAAGSLLDFTLEKIGMPVGRVSNLYIYPLSFMEFLIAIEQPLLAQAILDHHKTNPLSDIIHSKLLSLVGQYLAIGGMPESISRWIETKNPKESFLVHHQLADAYRQDFQKYAKKQQLKYLEQLFNQIPHLVGKQFKYSLIHGEYKKRELAPCLEMLCLANVVHKIHHSAGNGTPLGAEINPEWFKMIFLDTALCQAILGLDLSAWFLDAEKTFINRGEITESFVGQELLCYSVPYRKTDLYFWKNPEKGQAEIDYLFDLQNKVVPIEVKSGDGRTLKSMHVFLQNHQQSKYGIRFSLQNYSSYEKIVSYPLYNVVAMAHEEQRESLQSLLLS